MTDGRTTSNRVAPAATKGTLDQRLGPPPKSGRELLAALGVKCSLYVESADA